MISRYSKNLIYLDTKRDQEESTSTGVYNIDGSTMVIEACKDHSISGLETIDFKIIVSPPDSPLVDEIGKITGATELGQGRKLRYLRIAAGLAQTEEREY